MDERETFERETFEEERNYMFCWCEMGVAEYKCRCTSYQVLKLSAT